MEFTLRGRIKPCVRMTRRGKYVSRQAQEYLSSKARLALQMQQQMRDMSMVPGQTPFRVEIEIEEGAGFHHRDLDNEVKAVVDAANGIVWPDDRWMDAVCAHRFRGEESVTTMRVEVIE